MKDEPWRGDPAARCRHLEEKIRRQKERLAYLEAELPRLQGVLDRLVETVVADRATAAAVLGWAVVGPLGGEPQRAVAEVCELARQYQDLCR